MLFPKSFNFPIVSSLSFSNLSFSNLAAALTAAELLGYNSAALLASASASSVSPFLSWAVLLLRWALA